MIKLLRQEVELLHSISEEQMLTNMATILGVPYSKGTFDADKTKAVLRSCIRRGHESVLEHNHITLKCLTNIGVYKGYTRHRHCAFTIESTAFTNYGEDLYVVTASNCLAGHEKDTLLPMLQEWYKQHKRVKEARDWLPQCTAAVMIMTTNIRQWRYIIGLRGDPNDNPSNIELRNLIWNCLAQNYPFFFPSSFMGGNPDDPMRIPQLWR